MHSATITCILPAGTHPAYVIIPTGCLSTLPLGYNGSSATYSTPYEINGYSGELSADSTSVLILC